MIWRTVHDNFFYQFIVFPQIMTKYFKGDSKVKNKNLRELEYFKESPLKMIFDQYYRNCFKSNNEITF